MVVRHIHDGGSPYSRQLCLDVQVWGWYLSVLVRNASSFPVSFSRGSREKETVTFFPSRFLVRLKREHEQGADFQPPSHSTRPNSHFSFHNRNGLWSRVVLARVQCDFAFRIPASGLSCIDGCFVLSWDVRKENRSPDYFSLPLGIWGCNADLGRPLLSRIGFFAPMSSLASPVRVEAGCTSCCLCQRTQCQKCRGQFPCLEEGDTHLRSR